MANCKDDFLREVEGHSLLCAVIYYGDPSWDDGVKKKAELHEGYSLYDLANFLKALDYEYDSGYGGQEVFGFIWYEDGTWSERGEYDGSEWWEYKSCPEIPKELKSS